MDSGEELPDLPYTKQYSKTCRSTGPQENRSEAETPYWARSRSRSRSRGREHQDQEVSVGSKVNKVTLSRAKAKPAELIREEKNDKKKKDGKDAREETGKEQTGKEQTGKEPNGKEQTGKEPNSKEQTGKEQNRKEENVQGRTVCVKNNNKENKIEELVTYLEKNGDTEEKVETSEVEVGVWNINNFIVVVSSEEDDQEMDLSPAYIKNTAGASEEVNNNEDIEYDNIYEDNRQDAMGEDHSYVKELRSVVKHSIPKECGEDGDEKTVLGMEDQRRRNETQFLKKIKKFMHGSIVFHVCVCSKKFVTASSARAHAANTCFQKTPRRKGEHCICLVCSASFKSKSERRKHTQKVHPLYFPCHRCGCKFSRKKTWNRHVLACERGEKTHKCAACGYQSNSRGNMWNHKKTHCKDKLRVKSVQGAQYKPVAGNRREEFGHLEEDQAAEIKDVKIEPVENFIVISNGRKLSVLSNREGSRQLFQKIKSTGLPFPVSAMAAKGEKLAVCSDSGELAILTFSSSGEIASELVASMVLSDGETVIKPVWLSWDGPSDRVGLLTNLSFFIFDIDVKKLDPIFTFRSPENEFTDAILISKTLLEKEEETPEEENVWLSGIIKNLKESKPGTYIVMDGKDGSILLVKKSCGVQKVLIRNVGEEMFSLSSVQQFPTEELLLSHCHLHGLPDTGIRLTKPLVRSFSFACLTSDGTVHSGSVGDPTRTKIQVASVSREIDQGVSLCQGSQDSLLVSMKSALYHKDTSPGNNRPATEVAILLNSVVKSWKHILGKFYLVTVEQSSKTFLFIVNTDSKAKLQKEQVSHRVKETIIDSSVMTVSNHSFSVNVIYSSGSLAKSSFKLKVGSMPVLERSEVAKICVSCHEVFNNTNKLVSHQKQHNKGSKYCKVCSSGFIDSYYLKRHQALCYLLCLVCSHKEKTCVRMERHQKKHALK